MGYPLCPASRNIRNTTLTPAVLEPLGCAFTNLGGMTLFSLGTASQGAIAAVAQRLLRLPADETWKCLGMDWSARGVYLAVFFEKE